jgi:hypothetical protein
MRDLILVIWKTSHRQSEGVINYFYSLQMIAGSGWTVQMMNSSNVCHDPK